MSGLADNADYQLSALQSINDANDLLDNAKDLYSAVKSATAKQLELKQSLADCYGNVSHSSTLSTITSYVTSLPKFVEDSCTRFHSLSAERLKILSNLADIIELQSLLHNVNCLLISSLYWLRLCVRETIAILPYLIDSSIGLQDIHNIVSAVDAVEKLIQSGSLKQSFVSPTIASASHLSPNSPPFSNGAKKLPVYGPAAAMSTIYTLLLEPSSSLTLSKALNCFADVRAQLSSHKLFASIQVVLNPSTSSSAYNGASLGWHKNGNDVLSDSDEYADSPSFPKKLSGHRGHSNSKNYEAIAASAATTFQTECAAHIEHEVQVARSLIDCFSQSTGFIQALSRKTLRKSISMDTSMFDVDENGTSYNDYNDSINNQSRPMSKNGRRSKSVIWVDAVDVGVRSRLESAYSKWYFGKLKSAILGRCLFAMQSSSLSGYKESKVAKVSAHWSLDWIQMRRSCEVLLNVMQEDVLHGPPRELLSIVLSSAIVRSYELQSVAIIDDISFSLQEERLTFLERENVTAPDCITEFGVRIFNAVLDLMKDGTHSMDGFPKALHDQLLRLQLSTLKSLMEYLKCFISNRVGLYLARKSYSNFIAVLSENDVLLPHIRSAICTLREKVLSFENNNDSSPADLGNIEMLSSVAADIEATCNRYRDLFLTRLNEEVTAFLGTSMPLTNSLWRKRSAAQRQKITAGVDGTSEYVAFSVQPNSYAFGMFRACFSTYSLPILSSIVSQVGFFKNSSATDSYVCRLLFECVTSMYMAWLKFILDKRIKFSPMGARQLEADFQNVQFLIEQQIVAGGNQQQKQPQIDVRDSSLVEERLGAVNRELRLLPIIHQLRSVVYILLSKTADFHLSSGSNESENHDLDNYTVPRSVSAESDPSETPRAAANKKTRRRKRGVAPASAGSDAAPVSSRSYPIPFGADAWLQLVDEWPDNSSAQHRARLLTDSDKQVTTVCLTNCVPRIWRRTSPTQY